MPLGWCHLGDPMSLCKIDLGQLSRIHAFRCVFLLDLSVLFWKLQCICTKDYIYIQ